MPTSSVFLQDDQAWVVRLVASKAVRTPVRLGLRDRQRVEVLRKQTHPVDQGTPAEWEDFTDTDLVVRDTRPRWSTGRRSQSDPRERRSCP